MRLVDQIGRSCGEVTIEVTSSNWVQYEAMLTAEKTLPDAHLEIVKACGHAVDMEQPEALAKLVTNFIGRE